nr:Hsp20/alpha crystallin family protein [Pedobacter sp. SYP-B3415]
MSLSKYTAGKPAINGFSDVFESIFNDSFFSDRSGSKLPAVNIAETAEAYHIDMAAPGLHKEDFQVQLDRNVLTISVVKEPAAESDGRHYVRREFNYNSFVRSFALPESADDRQIDASYTNGMLSIRVAKKEEARNIMRRIEIS